MERGEHYAQNTNKKIGLTNPIVVLKRIVKYRSDF
jgi:hypothetical protein